MTRKIAIIKTTDFYDGDSYKTIINSITDWQEISDEEFDLLNKANYRSNGFTILEQPINTKEFIAKTIADYLKVAREQEVIWAEEKKKREEATARRKLKKEAKTKGEREKLFKELQKEFGVDSMQIPNEFH
jgi:hypothetical protein